MIKGVSMTKTEEMDIEIRDKNVDVKKIMEKIRGNIRKRREEQKVIKIEDLERKIETQNPPYNFHQELGSINANWDIENRTYRISSHRKLLGRVLIKGRELIHGEIKRYVDPVFWKQKEFNASTVRILNYLSKELPGINEQLNDTIEMNYYKFENKFRGSEADIRNRQRIYIPYFKSKKNVLDIGCGRGEFLELLKENGTKARGIDINKKMIEHCKKKGLDVAFFDAFDYLKSIPDSSLGGIFMAQVIEHFKPRKIVEIIGLSYKKLKKGSCLVIETINPTSFTSLSNFNLDPSHTKPLHPSLMKFLFQSSGFKKSEIKFLSPTPVESELKNIKIDENFTKSEKRFLEIYNANVRILNSVLFGYQDYSVIGKK